MLDLACGRGGDIWKWFDSGIKYVKGLDLSPGEVAEARQRYAEAAAKASRARPGGPTVCEFVDTPNLGLQEWREPRQYDVVTCMFALHYFFVSEVALRQFLSNVALNLKEGGYFIGTVPDGKRINECIRGGRLFESPMLRIEARWAGTPATFGSAYVCAIGDTVTGGEKGTEGSLEYLVYRNVLQGVAAQYGLKPVLAYGAPELEGLFDPGDAGQLLKHFAPQFPGSDPSLERASALFTAFAFQKTTGEVTLPGEAAAAAAAAEKAAAVASEITKAEETKAEAAEVGQKRKAEGEAAAADGGDGTEAAPEAASADGSAQAGAADKPTPAYKRPTVRRRAGQAAPKDAPPPPAP